MRGRSVIQEPACQSICAFCTHRLKARPPSHVQRRFLQSSRPAGRPPATGAAVRDEQLDASDPLQPRSMAPGWGVGGSANWGRSSNAASTFSGAALFRAAEIHDQSPSMGRLLPHEQQAREMLEKQQAERNKRQISIHAGAGPESTRAGRHEPRPQGQRAQINWLPQAESDQRQWNREALRRKEAHDGQNGRFTMRRTGRVSPRHVLGESNGVDGGSDRSTNASLPPASQWSQLRRREGSQAPISQSVQGQVGSRDSFLEGREKREADASSLQYTPISRFRRPQHGNNGPSENPASRRLNLRGPALPESPAENAARLRAAEERRFSTEGSGKYEERGNTITPARRQETIAQEQSQRSSTFVSYRAVDIRAPSKVESVDEEPDEELEARREARRDKRKKSKRSTYEAPEDDMFMKGKSREKARRRENFVEDAEEAGLARAAAAERAELKKQKKLEKEARKAAKPTPIFLPQYISVSNLAAALRVKQEIFVEKMEELGYEETSPEYILNAENAGLIAMEYNFEAIIDRGETEDLKAREPASDLSILPQRPPVVTIMGHVDHGKTTLLDYLRKSSVAASEHGGITQHIGAFSVPMPSGKIITFLDTPGHAAFLNMRQRGANVTDIVILVVAADDSVKPQTIEAINHAKAAKVPMIVAINKIDKEDTNIDRVKQDLARHGVDVEDFGGETQAICVSGKTGQGMAELEEAAVTLSEILDMRAEIDGQAEGWVLEASIKSMGKVATVLVRRGTVHVGDFIVAGKTWARIRCLRNEAGVEIESAGPGMPVEIDGWREQPLAGDEVLQAQDEAKAKSVVAYRQEKEERDRLAQDMEAINEYRKTEQAKREREKETARLAAEAEVSGTEFELPEVVEEKASGPKEVYFIVKGDVSGSVEAVIDSISMLGNQEVSPRILRSGVGQLSEFDIEHAAAARGVLINFNTELEPTITRLAEQSKVKIIDHNIIYRLVDDVRAELSKHLKPLVTQKVLGEAEIAQVFSITVKGRQQKSIAGCKVRNGTVSKTARVRVHRGEEKVFDGTLASLKNVKKDVQEMKKGSECGMGFDNWYEFQVGDLIQSYEVKEEKRYL